MRIAIVGSRSITRAPGLGVVLDSLSPCEIISGGARGADQIAEAYAKVRGVPLRVFRPDWSLGKGAGMLRNAQIVEAADIVVAVWDGASRGTADSIRKAERMGKRVIVFNPAQSSLF